MSLIKIDRNLYSFDSSYTENDLALDLAVRDPELNKLDIEKLREYIDSEVEGLTYYGLKRRQVIRLNICDAKNEFTYFSFALVTNDSDPNELPRVWDEEGAVGIMWCQLGKIPTSGPIRIIAGEYAALNHFYGGGCPSPSEAADRIKMLLESQKEKLSKKELGEILEKLDNELKQNKNSVLGLSDIYHLNHNLGLNFSLFDIESIFKTK